MEEKGGGCLSAWQHVHYINGNSNLILEELVMWSVMSSIISGILLACSMYGELISVNWSLPYFLFTSVSWNCLLSGSDTVTI